MLENHIFELVLNMTGIVDLCIKNYIVDEHVIWIVLLNGDCVCYNNKRIDWYRALRWCQIRYGIRGERS